MSLMARLNKNAAETAAPEERAAAQGTAAAAPANETRQEQYQIIINLVRSSVIDKIGRAHV
jgi:hypothetical protein